MRRVLGALLAAAALAAVGCGDEKSSKYCSEACDVWADCDWNRDECLSECKSAGDWDKDYLDCLKRQQSCATLDTCG